MLKSLGLGLLCTDEGRAVVAGPSGVTQSPSQNQLLYQSGFTRGAEFSWSKYTLWRRCIRLLVQLGLGSLPMTVYIVKGWEPGDYSVFKVDAPELTVWHWKLLQSFGFQSVLEDQRSCVLMSVRNGSSRSSRADAHTSKEWRWASKISATLSQTALKVVCCGRCCSLWGTPCPVSAQEIPHRLTQKSL